jgi:exonuclease VII large subunit
MIGSDPEFSVSEFIASFNQTVEYAFGSVVIHGELANFRISRNQWVYFDLKDAFSRVEFFGSVYALP